MERLMIYFENSSATVEWDETIQAPILTRRTFAKGEMYREPNNKVIELLQEKKAHKLLTDALLADITENADMEWLTNDWVPRVMKTGLRWMAVVMPSKVIVEMQISRAGKSRTGYESKFFEDMEQAKQWLKSVE
jgi:hypothetical protein